MQAETIAVVAYDRINPFNLGVPCGVFGEDRTLGGLPRFKVLVCAGEPGILTTSAGFTIATSCGLKDFRRADTVIVPSWRDPEDDPPQALLDALCRAHERGTRIVSLCVGSYVLAAAGLLEGRPATTHWYWAQRFAARYPNVRLNPQVLYVDDGDIVTSAGTAAGIDCCLHLIRSKYGVKAANVVARRLVVQPHRQGGQAQYIEQPVPGSAKDERIGVLLEWLNRNLRAAHTLDSLARRVSMTRRTFTRRFRRATGTTLGKWLLAQQLALAQRLLESGDRSIDTIAYAAGFGSATSLRQHFTRALQVSPSNYRKAFRGRPTRGGRDGEIR
jgi:transcriptional regulator GlxA family with amidase domain